MSRFIQERHTVLSFCIHVAILICVFILQTMFLPYMEIGGVRPDLLLIASVVSGMLRGKNAGMFSGFFLGILSDTLFGNLIGLMAFSYLAVGYFSGWISDIYYEGGWRLGAVLIVIGYTFHEFFMYFCLFVLNSRFFFKYELTHIFIPGLIYTMAASAVVYIIVRIYARFFRSGQRSDI